MADLNKMAKAERSAAMRGGMDGWSQVGSAADNLRYAMPADPKSRRRCYCGCTGRATHLGMANGVCLRSGCEWSIRRWVATQEKGNG